jgi:hypothetical protein
MRSQIKFRDFFDDGVRHYLNPLFWTFSFIRVMGLSGVGALCSPAGRTLHFSIPIPLPLSLNIATTLVEAGDLKPSIP